MTGPLPVIPLEYCKPMPRQSRSRPIVATVASVHCLLATTLIVAFDVETVIVTGPILLCLGTLQVIDGLIHRTPLAASLGASHIGICLLFLGLVNLLRWSPRDATLPFAVMGCLYVITVAIPTWMLWSSWRMRRVDALP